jgi:hypothetical protein
MAAGTPDQRRQEIARLDQSILRAEADLGLRPAPPSSTRAEESIAAGGGQTNGASDAPPSVEQSPAQTPAPPQPAPPQPAPPQPGRTWSEPPRGVAADSSSCTHVCRSVLAICDASARICRLAEDLDDAWASDRCGSATRSCRNAERRAEPSCGACE